MILSGADNLIGNLEVLDAAGRTVVSEHKIAVQKGTTNVPLPAISSGVYVVRFSNQKNAFNQKVLVN